MSKIKELIGGVLRKSLRPIRSYIRMQVIFAVLVFIGILFLLLGLADLLIRLIPEISRWLMLILIGTILIGIGYFQRAVRRR